MDIFKVISFCFLIGMVIPRSTPAFNGSLLAQNSTYSKKTAWSFDASQIKSINIDNNMYVEVYVHDNKTNPAKVEVKFNTDKKYAGKKIDITAEQKNGRLVVRSDMALKDKWDIKTPVGRLDIYIANSASAKDISINNYGGNVNISDVYSNIKLSTTTGNITANNVKGNLKLDSTTGSISAGNIKGDVEIDSNTGDISANNVLGKLRLKSGTGNIKYEGGLSHIAGHVIKSAAGDIELKVPKNSSIELEAKTNVGVLIGESSVIKVNNDLPFTIYSGNSKYFHGKLGAGKAKLNIENGSGDITIQSL